MFSLNSTSFIGPTPKLLNASPSCGTGALAVSEPHLGPCYARRAGLGHGGAPCAGETALAGLGRLKEGDLGLLEMERRACVTGGDSSPLGHRSIRWPVGEQPAAAHDGAWMPRVALRSEELLAQDSPKAARVYSPALACSRTLAGP